VTWTSVQILAQIGDAAQPVRQSYRFARLAMHDGQPWFLIVLAGVAIGVVVYVWMVTRRDAVDRSPAVVHALFFLRTLAFAGLLLFFLDPERRNIYRSVHPSQVLLLVDTSQSMGLRKSASSTAAGATSRSDVVAKALTDGPLLDELRRTHDVLIHAFGDDLRQVARLPRFGASPPDGRRVEVATTEPDTWTHLLRPRDQQTRLGDALLQTLRKHRSDPVAGVVVMSDGGQNAGRGIDPAVRLAREKKVGLFPIGIGSDHAPRNVAIREVVAPARVYPDDTFNITGYLMANGMVGRAVRVELASADGPATASTQNFANVIGSRRVLLGDDGEVVPVRFEVKERVAGQRTFQIRVFASADDENPKDDRQVVDVEIVGRESHVLLFAGGATREYRFLRNQLWRDKAIQVDVVLQSALPGISQDADRILDAFPATKKELYRYDAMVCFDPDWSALASQQVELLDQWVADEAGGLILVAGPVHTDRLARHPVSAVLMHLYPVRIRRPLAVLDDLPYGSRTPWPVVFTREGMDADYLFLEDSAAASAAAWHAFPGVYSCYPASEAKPGASELAHFSDPDAADGRRRPILFAEQFYGAGRVFYLGSGEMWRLRSLDEAYFETFYTKLIRHVAQGRLLRGSSRGLLLVDHDRYYLGDSVTIRAQLSDARHQPLALPAVTLQITRPNGKTMPLRLDRVPTRDGMYAGHFRVVEEGGYRIELPLPDARDEQLTHHIQVRVPDRERQHPQRNDALLSQIARRTGGYYYIGLDTAARGGAVMPLASRLPDRTEETLVTGAPDRTFQQQWTRGLLVLIAGSLCLEWLIRRLSRMA